jgi:hypothetical protein
MTIYTVTHLIADKDENGNPRRLYLIQEIKPGSPFAFDHRVYDEGYEGRLVYQDDFPAAVQMGEHRITVEKYNDFLFWQERRDKRGQS